jgi:hypothetical protein
MPDIAQDIPYIIFCLCRSLYSRQGRAYAALINAFETSIYSQLAVWRKDRYITES